MLRVLTHRAVAQMRKRRPLRADAAPAGAHGTARRTWAGFQPPPAPPDGCSCAVNNVHDPKTSCFVLMETEWFGQRVKNGYGAPSLADMPISDGAVCVRTKLPTHITQCAPSGCRCVHHSALEGEPFLPWSPVAVLPQRSDCGLSERVSLG